MIFPGPKYFEIRRYDQLLIFPIGSWFTECHRISSLISILFTCWHMLFKLFFFPVKNIVRWFTHSSLFHLKCYRNWSLHYQATSKIDYMSKTILLDNITFFQSIQSIGILQLRSKKKKKKDSDMIWNALENRWNNVSSEQKSIKKYGLNVDGVQVILTHWDRFLHSQYFNIISSIDLRSSISVIVTYPLKVIVDDVSNFANIDWTKKRNDRSEIRSWWH